MCIMFGRANENYVKRHDSNSYLGWIIFSNIDVYNCLFIIFLFLYLDQIFIYLIVHHWHHLAMEISKSSNWEEGLIMLLIDGSIYTLDFDLKKHSHNIALGSVKMHTPYVTPVLKKM